jgi:hypothetical protein
LKNGNKFCITETDFVLKIQNAWLFKFHSRSFGYGLEAVRIRVNRGSDLDM